MRTKAVLALIAMHADAVPAHTDWPSPMHEPAPVMMTEGDRLEARFGDDDEGWAWDLQGWYGDGTTRLRWKAEGEAAFGERPGEADGQLLYARLFHPYWEWQLGLRHSFEPVTRNDLVVGIQGTAPWMIEIDAAIFIGDDGHAGLNVEAEHDLYVTQRAALQTRFEVEAAAQRREARGVAGGIGETALGLRLRYEFRREFAPYVGVEWERLWGATANAARIAGEPESEIRWLAGIRFWF